MSNNGLYGGEDIGAVVIDVGSQSVRVGYAQEDFPKAEIPSAIGIHEEIVSSGSVHNSTNGQKDSVSSIFTFSNFSRCGSSGSSISAMSGGLNVRKKYYIDYTAICAPKDGTRITHFMKDGMIEEWDIFEKVLDYIYEKCIKSESKSHPVIMSEYCLNTRERREKLMQLMFEKYQVPAFFLVKSPVLAAFASGRSSALILDSGTGYTSAIPVYEGYVIGKAIVQSPLAGDFITMQCKQLFQEKGIDVIPPYMVQSKLPVKDKEKPSWSRKKDLPDVTPSFHNYMIKRVAQDFQHSVLHVSDLPFEEKEFSSFPTCHYEFPNGYNQDFGYERFRIPESLFNPRSTVGDTMMGVSSLVKNSIALCDPDIRNILYSNVVVTGGTTLIRGYTDRLTRDLMEDLPYNVKLKVVASNSNIERRFAAWIGGSILASVGTFQQLWISRSEYTEFGTTQLERKCP